MRIPVVDAAIDMCDSEDAIAAALADLLDDEGAWDWSDGSEHDPSDRLAVVESSGAWWVVYRGTEADEVMRFGDGDRARAEMWRQADQIESEG